MSPTWIDPGDTETITRDLKALRSWRTDGLKVALVYGGLSAEDRLYLARCPVDQRSVTALGDTLTALGTRHEILDPCRPDFIRSLPGFDVALSNLHGPYGEDGRLQGLLDYLRVPYCGNGVAACAVAADKILCKRVMESLDVPTPAWQTWNGGSARWPGHAVMVKPSMGGSSVGMSLVPDQGLLDQALAAAAATDPSPVLVEQYHPGLPVTVGLLELPSGVLALPPLSTRVHHSDWYDADTKLDPESQSPVTVELADLPPAILTELTTHSRALWEALGCHGMARVDFLVTDTGELYALEVNPTPGMSSGSNFVTGAAVYGITHEDTVRAALHEALTRPPYDVPLPTPAIT